MNVITGDTQNIGLYIALAAVSLGIIICVLLIAKNKRR